MEIAAHLGPARLIRTALMVCLGLVAVFIEAAPLGVGPEAPPSPDLLLCVVFFWTARRPESAPLPAIFALGLVRDLMADLPTGAGALTLVLAAEAVRALRPRLARSSFMLEWAALGAAALCTAALLWLLIVLTLTQPPYVEALFHQSLYTAMAYPVLAIAARWGLGISWRKAEAP